MDLKKLISGLKPDSEISKKIESVIKKINASLNGSKINAVCVAGGSVAKGTFLKGDFDVDLFVKFDLNYKGQNISDILDNALDFKKERLHGSRDYFQFKDDGLNYEIVPVLDFKDPEESENVTDMSHMHVDWVKKRLIKGQEDEIRLAKKFCKTQGCYGAESHIQGFSGHVLDILIIHHGTFSKLLEASQKWKPKVVIDVMKHFKNNQEILFTLNRSKIDGPMIVIDPILKTRNAASALSYEKFSEFKKAAGRFLKRPSEDFFEERVIDGPYLKSRFKKNIFLIHVKVESGKSDVIGSRIVKAHKFVKSEMNHLGYGIKDSGWYWNNKFTALIWIVLKDANLPEHMVLCGPPVDMKEACKNFKSIYGDVFEKDGKLFTRIRVANRDALANLEAICNKQDFLERVKLKDIEAIN